MSTFDPETGRHLLPPEDDELELRRARLRQLGLGDQPVAEFDDFAAEMAAEAAKLSGSSGTPYAMVNLITDHQYFAGLHVPEGSGDGGGPEVGRIMERDHGYCPNVLDRRKALVLDDVCAYPRFASNEVVDMIGIRTYLGAPLIDDVTGTVLGTVCIVDTEPRPWGRDGLEFIRHYRDELMERLRARETGAAEE